MIYGRNPLKGVAGQRGRNRSAGDSLKRGRTDYTAFRVDYDRDWWDLLTATISYTDCRPGSRSCTRSTQLMRPVRA